MKKLFATVLIITLIIITLSRCAKIVAPSGGPMDTLAPVLVRSTPAINSVNYKGDRITLTFNEIIQLKDIQKKLAISPPMIKRPEILQRGKSLDIYLKEPLKENTTYTIYFADAIVDNNEGNPLRNFVFPFSTGSVIDSLVVSGKIINAFKLQPEENAFIMLYDEQSDSMPIKTLPRYLTRSDKNGFFTFKNLQSKDYKVFALVDNNSNYKFDQITEDIAFLSEPIKKEILKNPSSLDTSKSAEREIYLRMFKEDSRVQALTGFSRAQRKRLALSFTKKPEGAVTLNPLNFKADSSWYIREVNQQRDSLIYWITDNKISAMDSLRIQLSYLKTDSLQRLQPKLDTIILAYSDIEAPKTRRGDKKDAAKKVYLSVKSNLRNEQVISPTTPIELLFPAPLKKLTDSLISIKRDKDSSIISGIKLLKDSLNPRLYRLNYSWDSDVNYKVVALPGAFTSLYNITNDTLKLKFKGANPENFGVISINLLNAKKTVIVELLDDKKTNVINRKIAQDGEKVSFNFVTPGRYTLRFIDDLNNNGKWDTGWYLKGIQPEKVYHFDDIKTKGILNIRANWENEITFDFATN